MIFLLTSQPIIMPVDDYTFISSICLLWFYFGRVCPWNGMSHLWRTYFVTCRLTATPSDFKNSITLSIDSKSKSSGAKTPVLMDF